MAREWERSRQAGNGLEAGEVLAYLREHPDFLVRHGELMEWLSPPTVRHGDNVLDLQCHMIERLRSEVGRVRDEQRELISTTRANLNNQARIHAAVLLLLDARSVEHFLQTLTTDLAVLLDLDLACLVVEAEDRDLSWSGTPGFLPRSETSGLRVVRRGRVEHWLGRNEVLLAGQLQGDPELFGGAAGLVHSQALIRLHLGADASPGLLAFGSREPDMFHSGQGTELVGFLARVVERCLRIWLGLAG
jgi:uncharacterized protein YigA (DUF484 family)